MSFFKAKKDPADKALDIFRISIENMPPIFSSPNDAKAMPVLNDSDSGTVTSHRKKNKIVKQFVTRPEMKKKGTFVHHYEHVTLVPQWELWNGLGRYVYRHNPYDPGEPAIIVYAFALKQLAEQFPEEGYIVLHHLAMTGSWELFIILVNKFPEIDFDDNLFPDFHWTLADSVIRGILFVDPGMLAKWLFSGLGMKLTHQVLPLLFNVDLMNHPQARFFLAYHVREHYNIDLPRLDTLEALKELSNTVKVHIPDNFLVSTRIRMNEINHRLALITNRAKVDDLFRQSGIDGKIFEESQLLRYITTTDDEHFKRMIEAPAKIFAKYKGQEIKSAFVRFIDKWTQPSDLRPKLIAKSKSNLALEFVTWNDDQEIPIDFRLVDKPGTYRLKGHRRCFFRHYIPVVHSTMTECVKQKQWDAFEFIIKSYCGVMDFNAYCFDSDYLRDFGKTVLDCHIIRESIIREANISVLPVFFSGSQDKTIISLAREELGEECKGNRMEFLKTFVTSPKFKNVNNHVHLRLKVMVFNVTKENKPLTRFI